MAGINVSGGDREIELLWLISGLDPVKPDPGLPELANWPGSGWRRSIGRRDGGRKFADYRSSGRIELAIGLAGG